jgi:phosphoserine phosphatase RsbU/P
VTADRDRFDGAPCGLLQTSEDGTIRLVNRTFCAWAGRPAEELVGRRLQDLLTVGGRIFHHTHWAPLLRMQGSVSEVKLELVHRDGSVVPMVFNAVRRDEGGAVVHEVATFVARDRDRYEQELVRSRRKLEELVTEANALHGMAKDRAVFAEQMIGIVSHDLRNPLGAIQMGTALLGNAALTPNQQRVVDRINRATNRASRLIADLLDFTQARLGSGIVVKREPLDLHETVGEAIEELRLAHPLRAMVHARRGGGPCVGDASRIAQLLGNLVANAVAYGTAEQPITVTSSVAETSCAIAVHNTGQPIPSEIQAKLFEPMTRGQSGGSASRSVGLGLYIVREIARAHGGGVRVDSSAESGTTFEVTWPSVGA